MEQGVTRHFRRSFAIIGILGVAVIALVLWVQDVNRRSAISAAREWARLAPLPTSARDMELEIKGSMFTREFVITFDASPVEIQKWLDASPGPSSAIRRVDGDVTTYAITPGGGAQFAEVKVEGRSGRVVIRTDWS